MLLPACTSSTERRNESEQETFKRFCQEDGYVHVGVAMHEQVI